MTIDLDTVLEQRDIEGAHQLAVLAAKDGDDEMADYLHHLARRWNREDWAYDESIGN